MNLVQTFNFRYLLKELGSLPENTNFGIKASVVKNLLDSNSVQTLSANQSRISKTKLAALIENSTYYISCGMTIAQIERMKTEKVIFSDLLR